MFIRVPVPTFDDTTLPEKVKGVLLKEFGKSPFDELPSILHGFICLLYEELDNPSAFCEAARSLGAVDPCEWNGFIEVLSPAG